MMITKTVGYHYHQKQGLLIKVMLEVYQLLQLMLFVRMGGNLKIAIIIKNKLMIIIINDIISKLNCQR